MIRVSKDRDGLTSPSVQRHAIESLAASNQIDIVGWVEGIDESGSRAKSAWWPRLDQAMDRLEAGEFEVILVWKFSRTGRRRLKWAIALDRVDTAGGEILSASEPIETRTASGKFARGMLGEMNAYQADLIGETWKDAHARRFREGKPINGKPRFGYVYDRDTGFTPDPLSAPILAEAYRRYISGESFYALVAWMNAGPTRPVAGYGNSADGLWSDRTLRRILDSGFAAGLISYQRQTKRGTHEPLITETEWDAYLEARGRRRIYRRSERSEYQFSGLVYCECGSKMHGGVTGGTPQRTYRCKDGHEKRKHAGRYVAEKTIEDAVLHWLRDRKKRVEAEAVEGLERRPVEKPSNNAARLSKRLAQLANKQVMLAQQRFEIGMPQEAYEALRDRYLAEASSIEQELRTIEVRHDAPIRVLPVLLDRWKDLEIPERREYLRSLVAQVVVHGARHERWIEIVPVGTSGNSH